MGRAKEVDAWFVKLDHPLKGVMQLVRGYLLAADQRMGETIKWQSPTFVYEGNLASINPRAKAYVSLLFHTGAHIPGKHPELEGGAGTAAYMKITDVADAKAKKRALERIARAWCDWKDAGPAKSAAKPKALDSRGTRRASKDGRGRRT